MENIEMEKTCKYLVSNGVKEELYYISWDLLKHSIASEINWVFFRVKRICH